jgi:hypothetical protein
MVLGSIPGAPASCRLRSSRAIHGAQFDPGSAGILPASIFKAIHGAQFDPGSAGILPASWDYGRVQI